MIKWDKEIFKRLEFLNKHSVKRNHEDNLKAELYHYCKLHNIELFLECILNHSRCDAVAVINNEAKVIIEIKNPKRIKEINLNTKQFKKYSEIDLPVIVLSKYENVLKVVFLLEKHLKENEKLPKWSIL